MQRDIYEKNGYTVYNVRFANLTDLYDYLKSNPEVNTRIFSKQSSLKSDTSFYGEPLEKAIEYCIDGYTEGFDNFLESNNELKQANIEISDNRRLVRSFYGGVPLAPLVAAGVPDCMLKYERDTTSTVRNIYFKLGYPWNTSNSAIVNRGLATLFIIQALEERGELINFRAFELSSCSDEIANIEINLKKPGDLFLDVQKCYFPMTGKEFFRRNFFRVLESIPVRNYYWQESYGSACDIDEIKYFYETSSKDLVISFPRDMGVYGNDLYDDTASLIKNLGLQEEFDIQKIKKLKYKE